MSQLKTNYEIISDKSKNPVTNSEYIKHGDKWLDEVIDGVSNFVTPEMFGAVGDGVTDDTEAVQSAFNSGKNVYFSSDKYYLSENIDTTNFNGIVISNQNVNILGEGRVGRIIGQGFYQNVGNVFNRTPNHTKASTGDKNGESALIATVHPTPNFDGDAVGGLFTAVADADTKSGIWGMNVVTNAKQGFTNTQIGIEIDMDNNIKDLSGGTPTVIGVGVSGWQDGTYEAGVRVDRQGNMSQWNKGVSISNSSLGLFTDPKVSTGVYIQNPKTTGIYVNGDNGAEVGANINQSKIGVRLTNQTQKAIEITGSPVGIELSGSGLGIDCNGRGIRFDTSIVRDVRLLTATVPAVTIPHNSSKSVFVKFDGFNPSQDHYSFANPYTYFSSNISWCCRNTGSNIELRLTNPTSEDISIDESIWKFVYMM